MDAETFEPYQEKNVRMYWYLPPEGIVSMTGTLTIIRNPKHGNVKIQIQNQKGCAAIEPSWITAIEEI